MAMDTASLACPPPDAPPHHPSLARQTPLSLGLSPLQLRPRRACGGCRGEVPRVRHTARMIGGELGPPALVWNGDESGGAWDSPSGLYTSLPAARGVGTSDCRCSAWPVAGEDRARVPSFVAEDTLDQCDNATGR